MRGAFQNVLLSAALQTLYTRRLRAAQAAQKQNSKRDDASLAHGGLVLAHGSRNAAIYHLSRESCSLLTLRRACFAPRRLRCAEDLSMPVTCTDHQTTRLQETLIWPPGRPISRCVTLG
jgi:hypothetical protein